MSLSRRRLDGAFRNFEHIIIGAYRWLSENYTDGDCIFLFGEERIALSIHVSIIISSTHRFLSWSVSSSYAIGDDS